MLDKRSFLYPLSRCKKKRAIMMTQLRKLLWLLLLQLIFTSLTRFQPLHLQKPQRKQGGEYRNTIFFKGYLLLLLLSLLGKTVVPCLTPPESQIPSVVPGCLSVTAPHAQFNTTYWYPSFSATVEFIWKWYLISWVFFLTIFFFFPLTEILLQKSVFLSLFYG